MITKKEACEFVVSSFARKELGMEVPIDFTKIPQSSVLQSSTLAVAMEYLGLITEPTYIEYTSNRGGIVYVGEKVDSMVPIVSFREILNSLSE